MNSESVHQIATRLFDTQPGGCLESVDVDSLSRIQASLVEILRATKLVIWDLDNTLWDGVLAEGAARTNPAYSALVMGLARRGIISSVCSHNERDCALGKLREIGLLEYICLPEVSYQPKGWMVRRIITHLGLRPGNVMFVDDLERLRREVEQENPGVLSVPREFLAHLDLSALPVTDPDLERLGRYKTLERKVVHRQALRVTNDAFLKQSRVKLHSTANLGAHLGRLHDLIQRTNQLNFTKRRIDQKTLKQLLSNPEVRCAGHYVRDRYGDYGLCGFSAVTRPAHRLDHFVFSCRVLGMGVERVVYQNLGRPELELIGDVAYDPRVGPAPDWVEISSRPWPQPPKPNPKPRPFRVLIKGGCDLKSMMSYLRARLPESWRVHGEFQRVSPRGHVVLWHDHTDVLRLATQVADGLELPEPVGRLPWFDSACWTTRISNSDLPVRVLSLLQDYGCGTYRLRGSPNVHVPCEYFGLDMCNPEVDTVLFGQGAVRSKSFGISPRVLSEFRSEFEPAGPITAERLHSNLRYLLDRAPVGSVLVVLNGAEVDPGRQPYPFDDKQVDRHRKMNEALGSLAAAEPRLRVVDVRRWVRGPDQIADRLFHYERGVYSQIADAVADLLQSLPGADTAR